jgi:hypothetical protein
MMKMSKNPAKAYKDWHWKIPHAHEIEVEDDDLPDTLIETGRLVQLNFREIHHNPKRKDKAIELTPTEIEKSHLAFDPNHRNQRLYIVIPKKLQNQMKKVFWTNSKYPERNPAVVAQALGGRHATDDYPDVKVKPIGILTAAVYATEKGNDGHSWYIHHMGEETGIRPALTIDKDGRIWIVGGDYTSPIQGITN